MIQPYGKSYAEVAVDVPAAPGRTFSYRVPDGLDVSVGQLVRVPFGARTLQGVVISIADSSQVPPAETRDIADLVFEEPLLDEIHLNLASWMSDYYMCSLFDAVTPMLPPGSRVRARIHLTLPDSAIDSAPLTPFQQRIVDYIASRGSVTQGRLANALGGKCDGLGAIACPSGHS